MSRFSDGDQQYLLNDQYAGGSNLATRVNLHKMYSTNKYGWHRWLFEQISFKPGLRILELGTGTGAFWKENTDRLPFSGTLLLSDFSPGMLEEARRQIVFSTNIATEWKVIDAQSIPFEDARFDIVIANHMLYHVPDRRKALGEISRVLKSDGIFYAATNGRSHLSELDKLVPEAERDDTAEKFGLETGEAQLRPFFSQTKISSYEDSLAISDVQSVVDFILSTHAAKCLEQEAVNEIAATVQEQIAKSGVFKVAKNAGLFTCQH